MNKIYITEIFIPIFIFPCSDKIGGENITFFMNHFSCEKPPSETLNSEPLSIVQSITHRGFSLVQAFAEILNVRLFNWAENAVFE